MSKKKEDPVEGIINSPLKDVIVLGFAELCKFKPDFPVQFLGKWLKKYSRNQNLQKELEDTKDEKERRVVDM